MEGEHTPERTAATEEDLAEVIGWLDSVEDKLDEMWKQVDFQPGFPETRMQNLVELIGNELVRNLQSASES